MVTFKDFEINRYSDDSFDSNRTNNETFPFTIPQKSINDSTTSLNLIGDGVDGYGEKQTENFLHLLENFAGKNPPSAPVTGQLWYKADPNDPGNGKLKIWDGNKWDDVLTPQNVVIGDFKITYDSNNERLNFVDISN